MGCRKKINNKQIHHFLNRINLKKVPFRLNHFSRFHFYPSLGKPNITKMCPTMFVLKQKCVRLSLSLSLNSAHCYPSDYADQSIGQDLYVWISKLILCNIISRIETLEKFIELSYDFLS